MTRGRLPELRGITISSRCRPLRIKHQALQEDVRLGSEICKEFVTRIINLQHPRGHASRFRREPHARLLPMLKDRRRIMNISNRIFLSVGIAVFMHLAACGDPKSQAPAIVVTFFSTPPTSIDTGSTIGIMAAVANDPRSGGVNFTCSPIDSCGLFNPVKIASMIPTCYEAPETVPEGNTVTITATSVTDPTKSVSSAPITILVGSSTQPCAP
jgi:hypothetical protein